MSVEIQNEKNGKPDASHAPIAIDAARLALLAAANLNLDPIAHAVVVAASGQEETDLQVEAAPVSAPLAVATGYEPTAKFDARALQKEHRALDLSNVRQAIAADPEASASGRMGLRRMAAMALLGSLYVSAFMVCYAWFLRSDLSGQKSAPASAAPHTLSFDSQPAMNSGAPVVSQAARAISTMPSRFPVYVLGAVKRPGVHYLFPGERVSDAVMAAGGVNAEANLTGIMLTATLVADQRVFVPARPPLIIVRRLPLLSPGRVVARRKGGLASGGKGNRFAHSLPRGKATLTPRSHPGRSRPIVPNAHDIAPSHDTAYDRAVPGL